MNKVILFIAKVGDNIRKALSTFFDVVDDVTTQVAFILNEYGEPLNEFLFTNAVKLERLIPASGFGNDKLAMLDWALKDQFIPWLQRLQGDKPMSAKVQAALLAVAKQRAAKFVAERNVSGDWKLFIDALTEIEKEQGVKSPPPIITSS